ncbi:uncharacterized protein LOC110673059 isoform X5 [Hevea brasiliensis]|uniref:uncharacterized protein LOC110673059 isoform X5 n=1 Tax=Hevea brasiliensis TaxID=3981 RepID=UPI0025E6C750|nr:uncharacterized protein LOC110673059 isoform X5 [Hevea brasiliensis]
METEADIPESVSLPEKDGVNRHLTPGEFNQPPETADDLLKSAKIEVSNNVETTVSGFEGKPGVTASGSFLESPTIAKVPGEETSRKQEICQAVDRPYQAEKKMTENEKQTQKDEKFKAAEEMENKENDVIGETKERGEKDETSCQISAATGISLKMDKIKEQCLRAGGEEISEKRISDHVEENPETIEKETIGLQKDEKDGPKENEDVELKTSKEASIVEASSGQNEETLIHIPDPTVHDLKTSVEPTTDAFLKNKSNDKAWSTETATTEENSREKTPEGVQEKKEERCSSSLDEKKGPDVDETIEKKESEKEGIEHDAIGESSPTLAESIDIMVNAGETSSAIIENVYDKLESPSVTLATDRSSMQEDDVLKVGDKVDETSTIETNEESQCAINLNENKKDVTPITYETQEKHNLDIPSVTQTEEMCLQKVDETPVSNVVQENWSEDVKESPQEEGQIEIPEKTAQADSSEGENVRDEMTHEQKLDNLPVNHKEGKQNIDEQLAVTEASAGESRDNIGHTVIAAEDKINDAITASGHSKDEPGNEEIKESLEMASEEIETTASGDCSETIACAKEDTSIKDQEESFDKKEKEEKSMDIDAIRDDGIVELENLQPKEPNEKIEIVEVEIPSKSVNELNATHSLEKRTELMEGEELGRVSEFEPQDQVKEEEKSDIDAIRDDGIPKAENPPKTELNEKIELAEVEIQNKSIDELNATHSLKQETGLIEGEVLGGISDVEPHDQVEEEEKSVVTDVIRDDGIPKVENLPPAEASEKIDIAEVDVSNKSIDEFNSTHSMEQETLLAEGEEQREVSGSKPQELVEEANGAGRDEENHDENNPKTCESTKNIYLELPHAKRTEITGQSSETSELGIEKLEEACEYDSKEKLEVKDAHTSIEEYIQMKEEAREIETHKLATTSHDTEKCHTEEATSDKICIAPFLHETVEQNFQAASLAEAVITLKGEGEDKENRSIKNEEVIGAGEVNDEQNIKDNIMQLPSEVINIETVQSSEQTEREVHISTGEDTAGQITEGNSIKDISQESVEECAVMNFQNDEKNTDKSSSTESFQESETAKTVDYIANEAKQNDERPNSTVQCSLVKEEGMQSENLASHEVPSEEEIVGDESSIKKDEYKEKYTGLPEVEERNEEILKGEEDLEKILQENEPQENIEHSLNVKSEETDEGALSKMDNIVEEKLESPRDLEREAKMATEEETTNESNIKSLSQQSVAQDPIENFQNDDIGFEKSNTENFEESKAVGTGKSIANETNQNDESLSATVPTLMAKEVESLQVEDKNIQAKASLDEKKEEDECSFNMNEENDSHARLEEDKKNSDTEKSKTVDFPHEMNQQDESLNSSTSLAKEVESLRDEGKNILAEASTEEKKEENGSSVNIDEDGDSNTRLEEDNMDSDKEKCEPDYHFSHEMNQNDESLNLSLQASLVRDESLPSYLTPPEAPPMDEKDENHSTLKMDEENGNNTGLEELKEQNEETLKSEEDSEQLEKKIETGENLEPLITVLSAETEAVTLKEVAHNTEEEIVENPQDNAKEAEMSKEEDDTKGHIMHESDIESLPKESIEQGTLKNLHNDEINAEVSNQEIFKESLTSKTYERIVVETNENNESPNANLPTASMKEEESLQGKVENINPTEELPEETNNGSLIKASKGNDSNTELAEAIKNCENERSESEEKREPELQKNETEELPHTSSNIITAETETGTLSEQANDIIIAKQVEAIQYTEATVEKENNEEGNEDIENKAQKVPTREDQKPEEETCNKNVSVETEVVETKPITSEIDTEGKQTSNNTEEEIKKEEIEEVYRDTKTACLKEESKKHIIMEAHTTIGISPQSAGEVTALINKGEKEEEKPKMERQEELEPTSIVKDTEKLVPEEVNVIKDQSTEPAIVNADDMIAVVPKKEMHEIIQPAENEYTVKQITEEGNATKGNFDVPVKGIDEEDTIQKEKEEIKSFNSESTKQIASRVYEEANKLYNLEEKQEPNIGLYPAKESEEGMLPKESNESLVEVFLLESQSKEDTLGKEEPLVNDSISASVTEVTKETSFEGVEVKLEDERKFESSGPYTQETGPMSGDTKGTALDSLDSNAPRDDATTLVEKRDHEISREAYEAGEDIKHDIQNEAFIAGIDNQREMIITATSSGKISDDKLMECPKILSKDSEFITSEESKPVNEDKITAADEVSGLVLVDTGIEITNEEARSYQSEALHQNPELLNEKILSKPEDTEILKMEETGDLVDQGEICNSIILEEEDSAKKSEAQKDDVEDSPKNSSLKKDDAVEKEDAKLATEAQKQELEASETKNFGIPTEENFESLESSKKLDCTSEIVTRDQSNETILDTNLSTVEEKRISESFEQRSQESQENQEETEEITESKLEAEDHIKETQNADETIKATILTEEVHKEVEKADFDETVKHLNKEENDIQEIHTVSTEDEREDEVKEFSPVSTESLKATDSNEQTETISSEVQVPQAVEKDILATKGKEERELEDADSEKIVSLSPIIPTKESEEKIKEQIIEDADGGYDNIKATTVVEVTTKPCLKEVLTDEKLVQHSSIPSDESKPHAVEVEACQQDSMVLEENSSNLASRLPPDHESTTQENATMEKGNANLDDKEDSGKASDVVYESRNQRVEELHIDEIREEIKAASETVHKSQSDETVTGIEVANDQTRPEEITKEHETPSLAIPCKEEERETKATIENIREKIEKKVIAKDEKPENSSALETTEDRCLQVEKEETLDKIKEETEEVSETALKSKCHNHEVATEDIVADDKEEKSEEQHQTESDALLSREHELEYSMQVEKIEESITEVELPVDGPKTSEECFLPNEESRDIIVSQLDLEISKDKKESPKEAQKEQEETSSETEEKKGSSVFTLNSNSKDDGKDKEEEISSDQTNLVEKPEEQNQKQSSSLLSKEQEDGTSAKIKSTEENKKEMEVLDNKSKATDEVFLHKEDPRELEVSLFEFQPDIDAQEESPNEIHDRQDGAKNGTTEGIKEVSELASKSSSEDHTEAAEDEIISDHSLPVETSEEQNQTSLAGLLSKEQEHGISTNTKSIEEKAMEVEIPENAPKTTEEGCIKKEETRELKTSQLDLQIDNNIQKESLEEIHVAEDGTPDEHIKLQAEPGNEMRDAEHPLESGKISESEITGLSEKTSTLKTELSEEGSESILEVHGREVLNESEETEIKEKHLEATTLDLMVKENQSEKTTDATENIHNEVTHEQIIEENDAKNCEEITLGEEGTKESHQDQGIKHEESLGDEVLTKATQNEALREEIEKTDASDTIEKQISIEKETVESFQQAIFDNILVEEATKTFQQEQELKGEEILGDKILAKAIQNEELCEEIGKTDSSEIIEKQNSTEKGKVENLLQGIVDNISGEEATKEIHQEQEIKGEEILGDKVLAEEMQTEVLCKEIMKTDASETIQKQISTEKETVENLHQAIVDNISSEEATEEIHHQHEIKGEESIGEEVLTKTTQNETIGTEKEKIEGLQQAVVDKILVEEATKMIQQEHEMKGEEIPGDKIVAKEIKNEESCKEIGNTDSSETIEKQNTTEKGTIKNFLQGAVDNISGEEATREIHQEQEIKGEEILADKVLAEEMQTEVLCKEIVKTDASETIHKQISPEKGTVENLHEAVVYNILSKEATEEIHQEHEIKGKESKGDEVLTKTTQNEALCEEIEKTEASETTEEQISTEKGAVESFQQVVDNILVEDATKRTQQEQEMKDEEISRDNILTKEIQNKELCEEIGKTDSSETIEKQNSTEKGTAKNLLQGTVDNISGEEATKEIQQEQEIKGEEILGDNVLAEEMQTEVEIVKTDSNETIQKHISTEKGTVENLHQAIVDNISSEEATEEIHREHEIKGEESIGDEVSTKATQNKALCKEIEKTNANETTEKQISIEKATVESLQRAVVDNILVEEATKRIQQKHEMKGEEIPGDKIVAKEIQNEESCKEIVNTDSSETIEKQNIIEKGTIKNLLQGAVDNISSEEATREIHQEQEIKGEEILADKVLAEEMQTEALCKEIVKTNASETIQKQSTEKGKVENLHEAVVYNISREEATEEIHQEHEIKGEESIGDEVLTKATQNETLCEEIEKTDASETTEEQISTEKGTVESFQQAVVDNILVEEATKRIQQEQEMKDEEIPRDKILAKEIQNKELCGEIGKTDSSETIEKQNSTEKGTVENLLQGAVDNISGEKATKEIHQEQEIKGEDILGDKVLAEEMQTEVLCKEIVKIDASETIQKHISTEKGTVENLHQAIADNISSEEAVGEESIGEEVLTEPTQNETLCEEIEKTDASETIQKQVNTEKGTIEILQRAVVDTILVEEANRTIQQENEMKGEEIPGDKILAKEAQNEELNKEFGKVDSSETIEKQNSTEKGTVENLLQGAIDNISGEEATKEIHQEQEAKGEEILGDKVLLEETQTEVLCKEIVKTDASETIQKQINTEKGIVENLYQPVVDNVSSEEATEEIHQEHEIKGEESLGDKMLAKEIQNEALCKEIQKTDASETIEKHISTEIGAVDNLHGVVVQNKTAEVHFPDETWEKNVQKTEGKPIIENQGDETISRDGITEATTATEKKLGAETSQIEVATGLAKASETTEDIHQEESTSDGTLENQRLREVELDTIISTGKKDVPQMLQELVAETTKVTEIGGSQHVYAADVDSEVKGVEHGSDNIVDEKDEKAIEETVSKDSAKFSLFDMMQKSTRERQAAGELTEAKEPTATKEEMKVEKQTEQTKRAKSDEEEEEEGEEHKKNDSGSEAPVIVEASRGIDIKVAHKKSHNILSGVGSKVKHSISKVKKAITGKSSHPKQQSLK